MYYYLMAQLPYLVYEQKPPMSSDDFKNLAETLLSNKDASLMGCLSLDPFPAEEDDSKKSRRSTGCNFIDSWRKWERDFRLIVAKQRVHHLKWDVPVADPSDFHIDIVATVSKAIDGQHPLEGEVLLDKTRWHAIEDLAGNDYFHRDNVFAYFLKLLLLERRQSFNVDKGFSEYKSLYASILESAHNSLGEPT
jgi:hypothetical protein